MKILIYGSCVSRDIFEYPENNGAEIVGYFARSSLASSFSNPSSLNIDNYEITSDFQKRMLAHDLGKTFADELARTDFDILLVDFIDERFSLTELSPGEVITLSAEFLTWVQPTVKIQPEQIIISGSPRHRELWLEGFNKFIKAVTEAGKLDRLVINRVHWASNLEDGSSLPGNYSSEFIRNANSYLDWMYLQASLISDRIKFIDYEENVLVASSKHRWGISPFHYSDDYYIEAFDGIFRVMGADFLTRTLEAEKGEGSNQLVNVVNQLYSKRVVTELEAFTLTADESYPLSTKLKANTDTIVTNGVFVLEEQGLKTTFTGEHGTHILSIDVKNTMLTDGVSVTVRVGEWTELRYLAIGLIEEGTFRHVKVVHPPQGEWAKISFAFRDLAYRVHNPTGATAPAASRSLRLYLKGVPTAEGSTIEVANFLFWKEKGGDYPIFADNFGSSLSCIWQEGRFVETFEKSHPAVGNAIESYLGKLYPNYREMAARHLATGKVPFNGELLADWKLEGWPCDVPGLAAINKYQWHSLHLASILNLAHNEKGDHATLSAARGIIEEWLGARLFPDDPADKFLWHDRATAERQLSLLYAYTTARARGLDPRYQAHLATTLIENGLLLESDAFYSYLQNTRYHKHAWVQDIALIATGLALPQYLGSAVWIKKGITRLQELIRRIIFYEEKSDQNLQIAKDKTADFTNMVYLTYELSRAITIENTIADNLDRIIESLKE